MKNTKFLFPEGRSTEGMISVSQIMTFMSCPAKWEYNYIDNLTPRVERPFLTVGKLCHKGMQTAMQYMWRYSREGTFTVDEMIAAAVEAMREEWQEYMDSNTFLAEELPEQEKTLVDAVSVFEQAILEFDPGKYEVLTLCKNGEPIPALELHFLVPCPGSKGVHGYIDAIVRERDTGFVWCIDYKFRKSLSDDTEEAFNIQNSVYSYACSKMGIRITGTMTWQHCNTPAADPSVNKDGSISRAKVKTTWSHYAAFCIAHGQDPGLYQEEMEPKLADIEWYRATYEYRNPETVSRIWKSVVIPVSWAIKKAYKATNRRHMYPWNCKMCQYQDLCQAELRGYDADAIRAGNYTVRNGRDNKVVDSTPTGVV